MNKKIAIFIIISIFLFSIPSYSQIRESGIIQGNVVDEKKNPLPGVSVTLEGEKLIGGPRSVATDVKGFYKFPLLLPGEYRVKAEIQGFDTVIKEGIRLHADLTLSVDIQLPFAKIKSEIIVQAVSPTVDVKHASPGGVVITNELLASLPLDRSRFWDVINLAPGISNNIAYASNADQGIYANSYQVDGVEISNPQQGSIWNFNPDFGIVEEINVKGLGLPAEYGEYTGTVLTATTKSGGNKFSTLSELHYNGSDWNSQNRQKIPEEDYVSASYADQRRFLNSLFSFGSQVGYKIIHDKVWFFVSGEHQNLKRTQAQTDEADISYKGFIKVTYELNRSNRLNGSVILSHDYTKNPSLFGSGGYDYSPEVGREVTRPSAYFNLNWTSIFSPTTFLEVKLGYNYSRNSSEPLQGRDLPGYRDLVLKTYTKNYQTYTENYYRSIQAKAHLTKYIADFLGSHDIKIGSEFVLNKVFATSGYSGGERYDYWNGQPYRKYVKPQTTNDYHFRTIVGFIQDTWSLTKRLTFNLGLRYDNYWYKIPPPGRGVIYQGGNLAPRLGLAFDIFGDRKTVFKLHYGLFHEALLGDYFVGMETRYNDEEVWGWDGSKYVLLSINPPWELGATYEIDPHIKQPYVNEITAGLQRELFRDASLSVSFFYRTLAHPIGAIDIGSEWVPITITNPGPDLIIGTSDDRGTFEAYDIAELGKEYFYITNPKKGDGPIMLEDPWRKVYGIEIVFTKRFSHRWQLSAMYNYGLAKGNATSSIFAPISPNNLIHPYGEGYLGLNYAQPNMFKFQANVMLPFDINLGLMGRWESGYPVFATFQYKLPVYGNWNFNGGEMGEFRTDQTLIFSLRFEKVFRIGNGQLRYILDINNLFNSIHPIQRYYYFSSNFQKVYQTAFPRSFRVGVSFAY